MMTIWFLGFFAGIYGFPEEGNKKKTWELIRRLSQDSNGNWICLGDLNDILSNDEKKGGNQRSLQQLNLGRDTVCDCSLTDLGFRGYPFTWTNGRAGTEQIQCRIDRALASEAFINRFSPIEVSHLPRYGSDHAVLKIDLEAPNRDAQRRKPYIFRFEKCWSSNDRCEEVVRRLWRQGQTSCESKLEAMKAIDTEFKEYRTNGIKKELLNIENQLKSDIMWDDDPGRITDHKELESRHAHLLNVEETMWRQRSRAIWLREGDKNTKFFHNKAKQRGKTNVIQKLKDEDGIWRHGDDNVESVLLNFFEDLFSSSDPLGAE